MAGLSAYLLAVTWGMALIITEVTGFSEVIAILMVWASYTLFTLYSGSRGVILTDTVMFLLFSSIIVVTAFFIVQAAGGWASVIDSLATYADKPGIIAGTGALARMSTGKRLWKHWCGPVSSVWRGALWSLSALANQSLPDGAQ